MQIIHKEGHKFLLKTLSIAIASIYGAIHFFENPFVQWGIIVFTSGLWLIFLQFFRNPQYTKTVGDNLITSPVDGEVVVIEETTENEYFKDKRIQVSIFMLSLIHI